MGFWSGVCSVISSVCSAVSSVFSGPLSVLAKVYVPEIEIILRVINVVVNVVETVCKTLGIWQDGDKPEELGDKAIQGAEVGITRDKYDTYDEYLNKIREVQLDPEVSAKVPSEAKLAAATTIGVMGIESHYNKEAGSLANLISIIGKTDGFFDSTRIVSYLAAGIDIKALRGYLDGSASAGSNLTLLKSVLGVEKTLTGKNDTDIYKELDDSIRCWKDNKKVDA